MVRPRRRPAPPRRSDALRAHDEGRDPSPRERRAQRTIAPPDLPLTREAGIGAYVGVPIRLWDGTLYGTLCCLGRSAEPSLNGRDVRFLRVLAEIVADQLDRDQLESESAGSSGPRIRSILGLEQGRRRVQPVFDLLDCSIVSLEALARFWTEPMRSHHSVLVRRGERGRGSVPSWSSLRSGRRSSASTSSRRRVALALNVSPATALDPRFCELFAGVASAS